MTDWLLTASEDDIYEMDSLTELQDFVIHNELRSRFDDVWTYQRENKILVEKVSYQKRKELERSQPNEIEKFVSTLRFGMRC